MAKHFWIHFALFSFFLILAVASKKGGKSKGGGWNSGSNRNPSYPSNTGTGGSWNPGHTGNRNPSYPGQAGSNWNPNQQGNTGGNWNPHYPANPGGSNWGNNYNPGGSSYNKQFKPPKSKTNMKMVAGAAVVGAASGFMLGNAFSNMRYRFDNPMDDRYYNSYRNQMPNQIYRPTYDGNPYVPEDRFVTDCYNISMTEYVMKPNDAKNISDIDQTEYRVKSTVIRELCVKQYRSEYQYYNGSALNLLFSPGLILIITLFVYFVVE
ncbi:major prion protein isoform 2-T3 [Leptodactylus fuscus]|uniref:major prion protein isoform X2 n=1 Tax=Leptodactylus fuscus TaxID=238119 RepID=UPI003F4E597A